MTVSRLFRFGFFMSRSLLCDLLFDYKAYVERQMEYSLRSSVEQAYGTDAYFVVEEGPKEREVVGILEAVHFDHHYLVTIFPSHAQTVSDHAFVPAPRPERTK